MSYCYVNGERLYKHIASFHVGDSHVLRLRIGKEAYYFYVDGILLHKENKYHNKTVAYPLGEYFGGNNSAPHDIKIVIDNL